MSFNIVVQSGQTLRLPTTGKYCDRDIVITGEGGTAASEYTRAGYVRFTGDQIVDTGIVCTQNTKIRIVYTRNGNDSMYLYGVISSDNKASVTAYLSGGSGTWRFGDKSASASIATNNDLVQTAIVDKTGIVRPHLTQQFSNTANFETVGSLLIGGARNADGSVADPQFVGDVYLLQMWTGEEMVLDLLPKINKNGVYGLYDAVKKTFLTSITNVQLEGGN